MVVGSGASAATCLSFLKQLGLDNEGGVSAVWLSKKAKGQSPYNIVKVKASKYLHILNVIHSNNSWRPELMNYII